MGEARQTGEPGCVLGTDSWFGDASPLSRNCADPLKLNAESLVRNESEVGTTMLLTGFQCS